MNGIAEKWKGFKYSPQTGNLYRNFTANNKKGGGKGVIGYGNGEGYLRFQHKYASYLVHRVAYEIMIGEEIPKNMQIDHINGDRSDNRWSNIRLVSPRGNSQNRVCHRKGALCGVSRSGTKFMARAKIKDKDIYIGSYDNNIAANKAYVEFCDGMAKK